MLGRPHELDGTVVAGDQRGGTLGYPTANLLLEPDLAVPRYGIYAGSALGHRAAVSIGTNPHYGGTERRIEPYLLDFAGDLYGQRLVVELWERLRDEAVFESEAELVAQIAADVERTRAARASRRVTNVLAVAANGGDPLIHARGLVKRFGELAAVDAVDFDLQRGEAFGFLGPNGAGKTSTMRMIGCVSPVTEGELRVFGLDPGEGRRRDPRPARRRAAGGLARPRADRPREHHRLRPLLRPAALGAAASARTSCSTSSSSPTGRRIASSRSRVA